MTTLRADAQRNREQIVAAAGALFAERGPDVSMDEVARRAGVGVGTLYRRFPDRESLVRAVAFDGFHRVVARARVAVDESDPWHGLTRFVHHAATGLRLAAWLSMWFARTWDAIRLEREQEQLRAELLDLLDGLVSRAQREGSLRPDVAVGDLVVLLALVLRPLPGPLVAVTERSVERHLAVVLDGLRPHPGGLLPGEPVTVGDLDGGR